MRLGFILQARIGSSRLRAKALIEIDGKSFIEHLLFRIRPLNSIGKIVLATGDLHENQELINICRRLGFDFFIGSEVDVLGRYYQCALQHQFTDIVRLTGDNLFIDLHELNRLIEFHKDGNYDFSHSLDQMPIGLGSEIFTFNALETAHLKAYSSEHREHVDEYILDNQSSFRIGQLRTPFSKFNPKLKISLDDAKDLRLIKFLCDNSNIYSASTEDLIKLCTAFV
jgi:spore coat polysaccharide biosynthesis protein SpsF